MSAQVQGQLENELRSGPASAAELCATLGISQPTLSRALRPLESAGRVARFGRTRGARYGLARPVGTVGHHWPLYRIDADGAPHALGSLIAVAPDRLFGDGDAPRLAGFTRGLPYYLQDARPAGFLGRGIPAAYPELALPPRVTDWSDEQTLTFLIRRGSESPGDLILGAEALDRYLSNRHGPTVVPEGARAERYPELAELAMAGAPPGSSAHGEHPKFSVRLDGGEAPVALLVKFSPPRDTPAGGRWADLLIAEALAGEVLATRGIAAAHAQVHELGDRVFLESVRFDRIGADGRRGVASLLSVDADRYGQLDRWARAATRLRDDALLPVADARQLALLDAFGELIGNTDRHFGNVTLYDTRDGPFRLAPVYDMLPMLYAPVEGQLIEREFAPEGARADTLAVWAEARELALAYWRRLVADGRLSAGFRALASACLARVERERMRARAEPEPGPPDQPP